VISNVTRGTTLATDVRWATSPWARFIGLMGRAYFPVGEALVFPGERWIHTSFMRFPIDVVFYDPDSVVLGMSDTLRPWRVSAFSWKAAGAIELPAGTARETETHVGDRLVIPAQGRP
jgi:uncharacterized membrane protein (UPF0127 family)